MESTLPGLKCFFGIVLKPRQRKQWSGYTQDYVIYYSYVLLIGLLRSGLMTILLQKAIVIFFHWLAT